MNKPIFKLIALNLVMLLILSFPFFMPQSVNPFVFKAHALDLSTYGQIRLYEGHNNITKSGNVFFSTTQKGAYSITISTGGGLTLYDVESETEITPIYTKSVNGGSSNAIYNLIKNQTVMIFANDSWTSRKVDIIRASETKYPEHDKGFYAFSTGDDLKLYGYNTTVIDENGNVLTPTDKFYYTEGNGKLYYIFVNEQNSKYADGFTKYFRINYSVPEFIYKTNAGGAEVYDYLGDDDNVEIPNSLGGKAVTVLQKGAFEGIDVNSIILPNTMTTIKTDAFKLVDNINYLGIPSSVDIIETDVFKNVNIGHIYCEDTQSAFTNQYDNGCVPECATTHFDCEYYDGFEINYDEEYCNVIHYDCYICSGGNFTRDFGDGSKHDVIQLGVYEESRCNFQGSAYGECNDCGAYLNYYLDLEEHQSLNYTSNNDATCKTNCTETGPCKWCSTPVTRDIPDTKVSHKFENYVSNNDATCKKNATETGKCKWCEAPDTREIANSKAEHKFETYVSDNNATCCDDGTKTAKCKWCDETHTVADAGSAKGHVDSSKVFTDVPAGKWFKTYVDYAVSHGIFTGTSKTTFSPNSNITRAQFVQVLANLSGVDTSNRNVKTQFTDVPSGKWYTAAVKWASDNKIVNGMGAGLFAPDANVTREQMCLMLTNYAKFKGITLKTVEAKENFADDASISGWAKAAVYACQQADIVNGKGAGMFDPKGTGTRAEASVIFTKFHQGYLK